METVFDHNPTEAELIALFRSVKMAEWFRDHATSQDGHFAKIAMLLEMRGEKKLAAEYVARIEDPEYRFQTAYLFLKTA